MLLLLIFNHWGMQLKIKGKQAMDINLVRSLSTLVLFILFVILIYNVYSKKNKKHYENAGSLILDGSDERSNEVEQTKVENHE